MYKEDTMTTSIRSTVISATALLLVIATAVPVAALAKAKATMGMSHMTATHKVAHHKVVGNADVKAVQKALDKHGAKLKVDGLMGKETEAALRKFQTKHHLKATGTADKATRKALGVK